MQFLLYGATAANGYDQYSHYLRAALLVNLCSDYATSPRGGCSANFQEASASSNPPLTPTQQVIAGRDPQLVLDEQANRSTDTPETRVAASEAGAAEGGASGPARQRPGRSGAGGARAAEAVRDRHGEAGPARRPVRLPPGA